MNAKPLTMKLIAMPLAGCLLPGLLHEAGSQDLSRYPLIPWPQHLEARSSAFALYSLTQVTFPALPTPTSAP